MKLHDLKPAAGSTQSKRRIGRGIGSGTGKTAGKGHKGQNARAGGGVRLGFEGGQTPLYQRLPKRGFNNIFAKTYTEVNLERLVGFEKGAVITAELLREKGIISKIQDGIVILGRGEVGQAYTVQAKRFTKTAKEKIEAAGGTAEVV